MVGVIVIHAVAVRQFSGDAQGYHLVVGGKGGDLQLVLSTVYHLGELRYLVPWDYYREFTDGEFAPYVQVAVPYCLGDSFDPNPLPDGPSKQLCRVVATTPDLFDKIEFGADSRGRPKRYGFREGRNFRAENAYEAVLGSMVAARTGVKVGDLINPSHGLSPAATTRCTTPSRSSLASSSPTGTANDRAVFVNLEGFYLGEGHALSEAVAEQRAESREKPSAPRARPGSIRHAGCSCPSKLFDQNGASRSSRCRRAKREVSADVGAQQRGQPDGLQPILTTADQQGPEPHRPAPWLRRGW